MIYLLCPPKNPVWSMKKYAFHFVFLSIYNQLNQSSLITGSGVSFYPFCLKCWWNIKTVSEDFTCQIILGLNASNTEESFPLSVSHTSQGTASAYTYFFLTFCNYCPFLRLLLSINPFLTLMWLIWPYLSVSMTHVSRSFSTWGVPSLLRLNSGYLLSWVIHRRARPPLYL